MKQLLICIAICTFAISCNDLVEENNKPDSTTTNDNGNNNIRPEQPLYSLIHPSSLSDSLKILVCNDDGLVNEGKKTTADQMRIEWLFNLRGESPLHNQWYGSAAYTELLNNLEKAANEEWHPGIDFLSESVYYGIKGITITADKKLFGRNVGENLSDKFQIVNFGESRMLLSFPSAHILKGSRENKSMTVEEWAGLGGMMYEFSTKFNEIPEEKYNEVSFTMKIETHAYRIIYGTVDILFAY